MLDYEPSDTLRKALNITSGKQPFSHRGKMETTWDQTK